MKYAYKVIFGTSTCLQSQVIVFQTQFNRNTIFKRGPITYSCYQNKNREFFRANKTTKAITMDPFLIRLLVFLNILNVLNTILNVIHKLEYIHGPAAHMAMAFLSIIILLGYSGILNTVFLKRKFHCGRIFYLAIAITCQLIVLTFSFLSYYEIITYFKAIAIIHALFGFITMINFTAAVMVVHEQQVEMEEEEAKKAKKKAKKEKAIFEHATKRASHLEMDNYYQIESILNDEINGISIREHLTQKHPRRSSDEDYMMIEMQTHKDNKEETQSSVKED